MRRTAAATLDLDEAQGCIANDDLLVSIGSSEVIEGTAGSTTAVFPVTLSATSANAVTFEYETEDITAIAGVDYGATAGTLTIKAGYTQVSIAVPIIADAVLESTGSSCSSTAPRWWWPIPRSSRKTAPCG